MNQSSKIDPVTVEVIRSYYKSSANQMSTVLERGSFSPVIYEVRDFSLGLYTRKAELIAEGRGLPVFMGTLSFTIRSVMDDLGWDNISEGDAVLTTYPYWTGAHSQDAVVIRPIFVAGRLFGFTAAKAHWMDLGAKDIYATDTTDIWQEGLQLKAVKIRKGGTLDRELVGILCANSRTPDVLVGDLNAQLAACDLGANRVAALVEKYGAATVDGAVIAMLDHGEALARQAITEMPDGEWFAEASLDNDGISDDPVPIRLRLAITGDQITIDLEGSAKQTRGPVNCPLISTVSVLRLAMKMIVAPQFDANEGFFRPLNVVAPEGTVVNPLAPAPVLLYGWAAMATGEAILAAFCEAAPSRSVARSGGDIGAVLFSGRDPKDNSFFAGVSDEACGLGAAADQDGENAVIHFTLGEARNIPVEILEARFPVVAEFYGLVPDSGGAGRFRGGLGCQRQWRFLLDVSLISTVEQTGPAPAGVEGGLPGNGNVLVLRPGTVNEEHVGKLTGYPLAANDRICVRTRGGAGWGSPLERPADLVLADVVDGYISKEAALRDYGVVLAENDRRFEVVVDATRNMREGRRVGAGG